MTDLWNLGRSRSTCCTQALKSETVVVCLWEALLLGPEASFSVLYLRKQQIFHLGLSWCSGFCDVLMLSLAPFHSLSGLCFLGQTLSANSMQRCLLSAILILALTPWPPSSSLSRSVLPAPFWTYQTLVQPVKSTFNFHPKIQHLLVWTIYLITAKS
jgi:hypothetical protein